MKINLWGINYAPELIGIAVYNTELSKFLADKGEDVTVVTAFPYYPDWQLIDPYRKKLYLAELSGKIKIYRSWHYVPAKPNVIKRVLHEVSFVLTSFLRQLFLPTPDVYLVTSPPLLLGAAACFLSWLRRAPFVFHIQDLQPAGALELKMLKPGLITNFLLVLEKLIYSRATKISVISLSMKEKLKAKNIPESKIIYFPNWVELPHQSPEVGTWKKKFGITPNTPVVCYSGNLGVKQGLEIIVEAARLLNNKDSVLFVISGDGVAKSQLIALKNKFVLDNLLLQGVASEEDHNALLVDSDICLITQRPGSGSAFFPSKLLKILAFKCPVITNAGKNSALHQAVLEGQFGYIVEPNDVQGLAQTILNLINNPKERERLGEAGYNYVLPFQKSVVLANFYQVLLSLK